MSNAPRWLDRLADRSLLDELIQSEDGSLVEEVTECEVDTLKLESGHIVACDPFAFLRDADAFARTVKPGSYRVFVGRIPGGENAFALLRFTKRKIARWEVARCPGEEEAEGWPGYSVDSGVGCFVDQAAIRRHMERENAIEERVTARIAKEGIDPKDADAYHAAFDRYRAEEAEDPLRQLGAELRRTVFGSTRLHGARTTNLVAFRAGIGDGVYASFWGLDSKDAPVCLVTDFGLLLDEEEEEDLDLDEDPFSDEENDAFVSTSDLAGLESLVAALAQQESPKPAQGPSPLFVQTRALVERWMKTKKIELEPDTNLDAFAEALLEKLVSLSGSLRPGSDVAEWLFDRPEVADVFASDAELEADLTRR